VEWDCTVDCIFPFPRIWRLFFWGVLEPPCMDFNLLRAKKNLAYDSVGFFYLFINRMRPP